MNTVLVALDNSLAGKAVVAGARALATLLGADVEALHIRQNGDRTARSAAAAASIPLQTASGRVVERLVEAGGAEHVVALAIGARGGPTARHPLGRTAAAVASALPKPVLIVPPDAEPAETFRRILVPLEGSRSSSLAPRAIFALAPQADIEAIVLHVSDEASIPAFTDQPQHEQSARAREFIDRYCPWGIGTVRLETRVGRGGELIPQVAEAAACDLIVLGWSRELAAGRAAVVRETLASSRRPVLLVPVRVDTNADAQLAASQGRR
jgi:nucleotide-binding universal stress UspA family protein